MAKDVLIKGVDEKTYHRAKAAAALKGVSMGKAVSEALGRWVEERRAAEQEESYLLDVEFVRRHWKKLEAHRGKSVVVSAGKLQGVFDTYEEACKFSSSRFNVAMTFVVERPPAEREIEIGPDLEV